EPVLRMRTDAAADPDLRWTVQRAAQLDRAAACAVHLVDQRSVRSGPPGNSQLQDPGAGSAHGRQHAGSAMDVSCAGRSDPASHDDVHAGHFHRDVLELSVRFGALLAGQQRHLHRSAVRGDERRYTGGSSMKAVESEGVTVEQAVERALILLDMPRERVDVEIVHEPANGGTAGGRVTPKGSAGQPRGSRGTKAPAKPGA